MGATALMIATQEGDEDFVEFFLAQGSDPNQNTETDFSPSMVAVAKGNTVIAYILVSNWVKTSNDQDY